MTDMAVSSAAVSSLPQGVREALTDFRGRLYARFGERLTDYRLFGSYARGDWRPDSDVDVLVVVDDLTERERREAFDLAEDVFFARTVHLAPLALSAREWQLLRTREYLIAADIEREGIVP